MNILYITDNLTSSSVFKSQVHNLCNSHNNNNNVKVLAFCKLIDIKVELPDTQYKLIKHIRPPMLFLPIIAKFTSLYFNNKRIFDWADIIHCRGHGPSMIAFYLQDKFKIYKPTIIDIRGAVAEEIKGNNKKSFLTHFIYKQIQKTEQLIFERANYYFFVSKNMEKYFNKSYKLKPNSSSIFPTIVNEKYFHIMPNTRKELRKKLKFDNKFVYVYSGGQSYWQNINSILISFHKKSKHNKNIHLLMLVLNKDYILNLIKELNINNQNITVLSLKYEDVGVYLNASDAGLIIRDDSIVNYVSSPTKINEYMACGLKIIDNLEQIGNYNYTSNIWDKNYMSLDNATKKQLNIYKTLVFNKKYNY